MRLFLFLAMVFIAWTPFSGHAGERTKGEDHLVLELPGGSVQIRFLEDLAPQHVERVRNLTKAGFYDGLAWFRVIEGFMAQTGYPLEVDKAKHWGTHGKSDFPDLPDEFSNHPFRRGTVGMGRSSSPNSANSQFFICLTDAGCKSLTGAYTAWGKVTRGMELLDALPKGEPPASPEIIRKARLEK